MHAKRKGIRIFIDPRLVRETNQSLVSKERMVKNRDCKQVVQEETKSESVTNSKKNNQNIEDED